MKRFAKASTPPRFSCGCAPVTPGDDLVVAYGWLIESALLWFRWGAVAAIALLPVLFQTIPHILALLLTLGLALGNTALAHLCAQGPAHDRLCTLQRWATVLEWLVLLGVVGLWWTDPTSKAPTVLVVPLLTTGARWGLPGVGAAAVGTALALLALIGGQTLGLGALDSREAAILLGTWVVLLAPPAGVAAALAWANSTAWQWEAARDRRERAALRRYTCGLSPRQWEVLLFLARPELTYEAIAARLHLEPASVREYVKRIAAKWEIAGGRVAVVAEARTRGLLDLPDDAPPGAA